jgi:hypothetical protein
VVAMQQNAFSFVVRLFIQQRRSILASTIWSATMRVRTIATVAAELLAGCAIPLRNGENAPTLTRKVVAQKLLPDTLVRSDGTRCTPTAGKFRKTTLRSDAWCLWLVPPRSGPSVAPQR